MRERYEQGRQTKDGESRRWTRKADEVGRQGVVLQAWVGKTRKYKDIKTNCSKKSKDGRTK